MVDRRKEYRATNILLLMLFIYPIINDYPRYIVNAVVPISQEAFDIIVWLVALIPCASYLIKRINIKSLIIWVTLSMTAVASYILTDYQKFEFILLIEFIFTIAIAVFFGEKLRIGKNTKPILYFASTVALIVSFLYNVYRIFSGKGINYDNMGFAYELLPAVLMAISNVFDSKKKTIPFIIMVGAVFLLIMQGTRGPILCSAVFIMLMLLKKTRFTKFTAYIIIALTLLIIVCSSEAFMEWLTGIVRYVESAGFSSRVFRMLLEGEIGTSNGRDVIQEVLLREIKENPLAIRGLYADYEWTRGLRITLSYLFEDGIYAHNIFLELIFHFGVVVGGGLCIALIRRVFILLKHCDSSNCYIVCMFICTGFVALLMSGSYLNSALFFALIGLFINKSIYKKKEFEEG